MQTERNVRTGCLAIVLSVWLFGCTQQAHPATPRSTEPPAPSVHTDADRIRTEPAGRKPFSGEIVFRVTAVSRGTPQVTKDLGELHYFISGDHWKHVDANGETAVLYDPANHLIHYFKPQPKTIDASISDGPVKYEAIAETHVVLGRTCKGIRWTTGDRKVTGFYDPDLFVDAAPFVHHHYGHWAETLAVTNGALILWSKMELPQGDIISEPISIQPREFEASFWLIPEAQAPGAKTQP